jgi:hypothetical protein
MSTPTLSRFDPRYAKAVRYRWVCDGGCSDDPQMISVIKRRNRPDLRLCPSCYEDGWWRDLLPEGEGT